jgi:hypothetical protein
VPYRLSEIIVIPTAMNAWGHHLARRRAKGIEVDASCYATIYPSTSDCRQSAHADA